MVLLHRGLLLAVYFFGMAIATVASADVTLPNIFGDHMVIQQQQKTAVWGWAEAGEDVAVSFGDASVMAKASADGKWSTEIDPPAAGGPYTLSVKGKNEVVFKDVLVGEVWLCSGQSNMEWTVKISNKPEEEIAAGNHPRIRHIKIPHIPADAPQENVATNGWEICSSDTVGEFTAAGYYFGRHLMQELDVPIGLIGSNWGGTRIEPWTPPAGFESVEVAGVSGNLDQFPEKNDAGQINHQSALALYNGMISPLVPYTIRGAIWYQGESNRDDGYNYEAKMRALIAGWRALWKKEALPFYFVQLAPYRYGGDEELLAQIWEAQSKTLAVPHTGMAVTVDISNITDIHPRNKQDVGKRLALWALAKTYGQDALVYSGPLYESMQVEGDKIRIHLNHVGSGLKSRDGKPLSWFTIAGSDKQFVDATAVIDGNTVLVAADTVKEPVAVRFGWHQEAEPNLSNQEGLPASPFRTDSW